jgi:hypothetical protein
MEKLILDSRIEDENDKIKKELIAFKRETAESFYQTVDVMILSPLKDSVYDFELENEYRELSEGVEFKRIVGVGFNEICKLINRLHAEGYCTTEIQNQVGYGINSEVEKLRPILNNYFGGLICEISKKKTDLQSRREWEKRKREFEANETKRVREEHAFSELSRPIFDDIPEVGRVRTEKFKSNSMSFAIAVYASEEYYKKKLLEGIELSEIHIPIEEQTVLERITKLFKEMGESPKEVYLGHEHGIVSKRCFYQVCVILPHYMQKYLDHCFNICSMTGPYLECFYMTTTNSRSINNYCKREYLTVNKETPKKGYAGVCSSMSVSDFSDYMRRHNLKDFLHYGDRMISNFVGLVQEREIPDFNWIWPAQFENEDKLKNSALVKEIKKWFDEYCIQNPQRKKALMLFSRERGIGKSQFCKRLVPDPEYFIYDRSTMNADNFRIKPKARLLILDDIKYKEGDREMWKALVAGEATNIRTPYNNYLFTNGLPCIICSNNMKIVNSWLCDPDFNTQVKFLEVSTYIGPEGTRPTDITKVETLISPETMKLMQATGKKKKPVKLVEFNLEQTFLKRKTNKEESKENSSRMSNRSFV